MPKKDFTLRPHLAHSLSNEVPHSALPVYDRLIDIKEVMYILSIGRTSLFEIISSGSLPQPLHLSPRMIRWRLSEIMKFIEQHPPFVPPKIASNDIAIESVEQKNSLPQRSFPAVRSEKIDQLEKRRREILEKSPVARTIAKIPARRNFQKKTLAS